MIRFTGSRDPPKAREPRISNKPLRKRQRLGYLPIAESKVIPGALIEPI